MSRQVGYFFGRRVIFQFQLQRKQFLESHAFFGVYDEHHPFAFTALPGKSWHVP